MGPRMRSTEATIGDSSGMMQCVWFNQPWIAKQLPTNAEIVVSGRVSEYKGRPKFDNPEWELWSDDLMHTGRLVPVYPLTAGLPNRTVRRVMREAAEGLGVDGCDGLAVVADCGGADEPVALRVGEGLDGEHGDIEVGEQQIRKVVPQIGWNLQPLSREDLGRGFDFNGFQNLRRAASY